MSSDRAGIRFDEQVAIVTGAGSGLGRTYAVELASRGASVVCNDIVARAADETADEIVQRGGSAVPESSSVATPGGGDAVVRTAIDAFGSVDIVINNAGQLRNGAFEDLSVDDIHDVLATHLGGAFYVTQPAYRHMKTAGYGRIVFTSSSAGLFGSPWQASYAAAKAGVVGLCNVVALEGAPHGIKANAVMPMALTGIGDSGPPPYSPEHLRETVQALKPLLPSMTVENVAPLVLYLSSPRCQDTRCIFSVGCGQVARVVIGRSRGWYAPGPDGITPEQIEEHLDAACDLTDLEVPGSMNDEIGFIAKHMPSIGSDR
jgi:NAD(P)-dependent dehydrogenase (short-subunit alcohol dehydrogenase family)